MFRRRADIRDEIIRQQAGQIADLLDRLQELIGQVHLHQVQRAEVETQVAARRLHVSEDEDDINYRLEAGEIDAEEAERLIGQIGFENTELHLAY